MLKSEETSPTKKVAVKLHACELGTTNSDGLIIRFHTKYQSLKEVKKFKSHFHFLIRLYLDLIRLCFFLSCSHFILIRIIMWPLARTLSAHAPSTYVCHLSRTHRATSAIATVTRPCQITIYSFLRARHVSRFTIV